MFTPHFNIVMPAARCGPSRALSCAPSLAPSHPLRVHSGTSQAAKGKLFGSILDFSDCHCRECTLGLKWATGAAAATTSCPQEQGHTPPLYYEDYRVR